MIYLKKRLKKRTLVIGGILVVLIIGAIIAQIIAHNVSQNATQTIIQDPGYATILPSGRSIVQLGGWKRVTPEGSDPVYAYNDVLSGVTISVSEQTLPASFKDDVSGSVAKLAKVGNETATTQQGNTIIYIGTSAKGPQSVIFTKNGLLILIKSEQKIKDAAWSSYVASLQ